MKTIKTIKLLLISAVIAVSISPTVSAHYEAKDQSSGIAPIYHATPEHKPVLGMPSVLSFDFSEEDFDTDRYRFSMAIKPLTGDTETIPVVLRGSVVEATHTFRQAGFYDVILTATDTNGRELRFMHGQRVTAGKTEGRKPIGSIEVGVLIAVGIISIAAVGAGVVAVRRQK